MQVEFFFKQFVYRGIQSERKSRRLRNAQPLIQVKTARTIDEQLYLGAAYAKGSFTEGIK